MLSKINTAALQGIEAIPIVVETDVTKGMPHFTIVGLADAGVKESKERIRAAIRSSGLEYPLGRLTVNMSPADFRKRGTILDLPMAMGILAASGQLVPEELAEYAFVGELSLDGGIRRVNGVLPALMAMRECGIRRVVVPEENRREASLLKDLQIYAARDLLSVVRHCGTGPRLPKVDPIEVREQGCTSTDTLLDFAEVRGCEQAKRAIMVAVAGNHGILMYGSPSTGKSMLAERIPGIMPAMTYEEIMEVTRIYSAAGLLSDSLPYIDQRPFRMPYHGITRTALIGGGGYPKPGEITLANRGVLFLDEFCEFDRGTIDLLRQPLETREIEITRMADSFTYPADFLLVAATNPCKCGYYGDPEHECVCTETEVRRYQSRISGPIMDRIDIHLWLKPVGYEALTRGENTSTAEMREMVTQARRMQEKRFRDEEIRVNSQMSPRQCDRYIRLDKECRSFLQQAYRALGLNPRTLLKVQKVARTIADLDGAEDIAFGHLAEAIGFRDNREGHHE